MVTNNRDWLYLCLEPSGTALSPGGRIRETVHGSNEENLHFNHLAVTCGLCRAYLQICEWKRILLGGHRSHLFVFVWARCLEIKSTKRRNKKERTERGYYSWNVYTNTHTRGLKMEHWCAIYKWNKFNSFPEVQPSDLLITRDKLCVGICARVRGRGAVTCNHKTPQMGIHVGGPQRNLPSSLCRIHAIFGASGLLFGRSGQISSTVCTPSGLSMKKPFQTLWTVCFTLLGQVLFNNSETFFMLSLTGVYNKPKKKKKNTFA